MSSSHGACAAAAAAKQKNAGVTSGRFPDDTMRTQADRDRRQARHVNEWRFGNAHASNPDQPIPVLKASFSRSEKKAWIAISEGVGHGAQTITTTVGTANPKKRTREFKKCLEPADECAYKIPDHHRSSKMISNIPLYERMKSIVEASPTIVRAALFEQVRAHESYKAKPVAEATLARYAAMLKRQMAASGHSEMDAAAAKAWAGWFQSIVGDYVFAVNFDQSILSFRLQATTTVGGKAPPHHSVSIGMLGVSYSDGRPPGKWRVATGAENHEGMSWADFPHLVKVPGPTSHWVPGRCVVDALVDVLTGLQPQQHALLVIDNHPAHAKALARAGLATGEMIDVGGKLLPVLGPVGADGDENEESDKRVARLIRERGGCAVDGADGRRIVCVFLPPRTTGLIQPCDVSLFGTFKRKWKTIGQMSLWADEIERVGHLKANWADFRDHIPISHALRFLNEFVATCPPEVYKKGWEPLMSKP